MENATIGRTVTDRFGVERICFESRGKVVFPPRTFFGTLRLSFTSSIVAIDLAIRRARRIWSIDDPAPSVAEFFLALRGVWGELQRTRRA